MNTVEVVSDRNLILLTDDNRFVRKKALNDIKAFLTERSNTDDRVNFPFSSYAPGLSASLNDNIEVNRELAIAVNNLLISSSSDCSGILPSLLPILVKRLGQKDTVEPSEELRLETLRLLKVILEKPVDVSPYVDDFLLILQHSFLDPYHEVKKLSCIIIQELAKKKLHRFYQASESVVAPLLSNLIHQHSKVRLATVQAVGTVMIYSHGKLVEQTITPLTQRLFDTASSIRYGVIEVVGSWLLDLPDRYSYHTKLLPLILSGLIDDSADVRDLAEDLWHDIGLKFEKENEEQLKDKLDFDKGPPGHYPLGCKRPVIGCRELVYRSASRLLPALSRDLGDWQASTRSKAASLIPVLILHLEQATTQHTQHLLTGLGTGLTDAISRIASSTSSVALLRLVPPLAFHGQPLPKTELSVNQSGPDTLVPRLPQALTTGSTETTESLKVIHQLLLAAQLTGCLVEAKLWWPLLKSCLSRCTESVAPASLAGHLFLLAGFVCGSSTRELLSYLANDSPSNQQQITSLAGDDLLSVISFGAKAALLECVLVIVRRLEEAVFILRSSSSSLSMEVSNDPTNFLTKFSPEAIAAAEALFDDSETMLASPTYLSRCLTHLVLPACVWRAGRTAEAMRKAAVTCLVALMAAATSTYDLTEANVDSRTADEIRLDVWLCDHVESVRQLLGPKTCERDRDRVQGNEITPNITRTSSLPHLPSSILSLLLARLGGLLEDELEATRRMACLNLTIVFNGLLLQPCVWDQSGQLPWTDFLSSPTWLAVFAEGQPVSMPSNFCPLPNSLGDQIYRFYPNLIKRLNDAKDQIRLLVTETLNAWLRLVTRMLTCSSQSQVDRDTSTPKPTYRQPGLLPHLDDADERIRAAVARVMIRIGRIAPTHARTALVSARERHRAVELCNQLVQSIQLCD
ncbi:hypothetical protein AHF37_08240 [Paragonimus kellicotti]|nr:hypothetical protein AHF37_08240 [Paragonimus kellicotti]